MLDSFGTMWLLFFISLLSYGSCKLSIRSVCSVVKDDPAKDPFQDDQADLAWPKAKSRQLQARNCRSSKASLIYSANTEGDIPVDCGRCAVFDLHVIARARRKGRKCWGLDPNLLQSKYDCLFKSQCDVRYRNSIITWSPRGHPTCITAWPKKLETVTTCLNTERNPVSDVIKSVQVARSRYGFIRSHFYDKRSKSRYPKGDSHYQPNNTLVLFPHEPPTGLTFLLLHFHSWDLIPGDRLLVQHLSLKCQSTWAEGRTYTINSRSFQKVSLVFSQGDKPSSGHGFEICFQWFTAANVSTVMEDFEVTLNICRKYRNRMKAVKGLPVYDMIQHMSTQHTSGVIRSHPEYPWNYPRPQVAPWSCPAGDDGSKFKDSQEGDHWSRVTHVLKAPLGLSTLRITVKHMRLARHDTLVVCPRNGTAIPVEDGESYNLQSDRVTLTFSIHASRLHTNQGFLICYKWFSLHSVTPISSDLCKSFGLRVACEKTKKKIKAGKQGKQRRGRKSIIKNLPEECKIK
ncbi:hypothetical protein PoB_001673100 [Plakobranchus ocellatus]|uniref:CUB domain-containing protein n=1 Tax=Plakobranchus ocellatus TaxID=259542 RepID=A0AAV3Z2Y0_9GAST|nr:hypothetical protein PoB_001673100 [Plakobranchus ocellatus]